MDFIFYLIILILIGFVVGAFARLALPGKDPMSFWMTSAIGIAGGLMAGIVSRVVFDSDEPGFLMSLVFAALIVYFVRRSRGGGLMDPGVPPDR